MSRKALASSTKSGPPPLDVSIAALAGDQFGVVTLAQLRTAGLSGSGVRHRVARGALHRIHRGVFAVGHAALDGRALRLAAALACGRDAVLSHQTAAAIWGLRPSSAGRIHVTTPHRSRDGTPRRVVLHRSRRLPALDCTVLDGLPVTTIPRTLVDLADVLTPHQLERALHEAEMLRVLDVTAVRDAIDRMPGRRGTATLAALLGGPAPGPTRSELENAFLALCRSELRAEPRLNVPLHGVEVDALFDAERLVVELDGAAVHHTRRAFHRDRRRDSHLAAHG